MIEIAVTGVTGHLGGAVARRLSAAGHPLRLVARSPARAPSLPHSTVAAASYGDRDAVARALEGTEVALMVSAAESADRLGQHRTFIDAAAAAGVRHLVYISFFGAAADAEFTLARDHHATEEHLRASGLTWTALRDNLYADFLLTLPGPDGVIRGPAADGRVSAVARTDVADCAAAVLHSPAGHENRTYQLTGPAAVSLAEVAALLTTHTGRPISYHPETLSEARASRAHYAAPPWQLDAWISTYTAIASGTLEGVTSDVALLSGHAATPIQSLLRTP
ncbi:uncharacterized protein YbjT (DUF2867 family) [Catenuloplanes nepalensis]|uniref:Uncharacterized protein YbjT (DUF2867 family) n=1 Tax=Catenuloplanes nepalensis TaxID=587533 RepID=A0ABT9MXU7_9ACTN|nr:SDR family oxidoreductase [Catenuloplanes nepalensis]MDP9796268.1 uncharacterized protein YbjT (DUF2867 family) [Catenuloplanes nepalensis]